MKTLYVAVVVFSLHLVACGKTRTCKTGTMLINVTLNGATANADRLLIVVTVDGTSVTGGGPHEPGLANGTIELQFPNGYPAGRTIALVLNAYLGQDSIGSGLFTSDSLPTDCATATVVVEKQSDFDASNTDDLSLAIDLSSSPDMRVCNVGDRRCDSTNHFVEQVCDANGQWMTQQCPTAAVPPVFACSELKGRCVDTAWVQWSYISLPVARFTTVAGANNEDIVRDAWTGLSWQLKHANATYTWAQATAYCDSLVYGGYDDWRLPSPVELNSILDRTRTPGTTPMVQGPFLLDTINEAYWASAASTANPTTNAWGASVAGGTLGGGFDSSTSIGRRARCVR